MNEEELRAKLSEFVKNAIYEMEDKDLNIHEVTKQIPEYNADWCAEDVFPGYDKALEAFVKAEVDTYLYYYNNQE